MGVKKAVVAGILLIFAVNSFLVSQEMAVQDADKKEQSVSGTPLFTSDTLLPVSGDFEGVSQGSSVSQSRFGTLFLFLRMIFVLAFVIACIYAVIWFMRRSTKTNPNDNDPFLRKVASVDVAAGKSVQIITLVDKAYIIGVADSNVSLISEVEDKELIDAMNLYADEHKNVKKPRNFADVLDIFMPHGPREKEGVFSDSKDTMGEMLEKQRNRLKGKK